MIWSKVVLWKTVVQTETGTDIWIHKMMVSVESHIQAAYYHHSCKTYLLLISFLPFLKFEGSGAIFYVPPK